MRELEFRAWDQQRGQMYNSAKWVEFKFKQGVMTAVNYNRGGEEQQLPVMQYSGLKDKNGVKIFEGDILSAPGEYNSQVVYASGSFCIQHITGWSPSCTPLRDIDMTCYKIIGNEHENPELLEVTE